MIIDFLLKYVESNPNTLIRELPQIFGLSIDEIIKALGYQNYYFNAKGNLVITINKNLELVEYCEDCDATSNFIHYNNSGVITKIVYRNKFKTQITF